MYKHLFNKEIAWMLGSQLFFGVIGALLVQCFVSYHSTSMIATVNMSALQESFIQETIHKQLSQAEMKKRVNVFADKLTKAMSQLAKQKKLIIVPSEAVMAGQRQDLTEEVANLVKRELSR